MAENNEGPLIPKQTQRAALALANLFLYSVAMFTLPFVAYFGVRHVLTDHYSLDNYTATVWAVVAAVVVVNGIICVYAYKAYHETEYDDEGNEVDQHSYSNPPPAPSAEVQKNSLNVKQD